MNPKCSFRYGIKLHDYFTQVDGEDTPSKDAFAEAVRKYLPTEILTLSVVRGGPTGRKSDVKARMVKCYTSLLLHLRVFVYCVSFVGSVWFILNPHLPTYALRPIF